MAYSGQAAIGYETGYQDGVFGRARENPYNVNTVPKSWRAYEEGYTDGENSTTPPRGATGLKGDKGDKGDTGNTGVGIQGTAGTNGFSFLQGAGPPASGLGIVGDTYWDTTTAGDIYEKTGSTTWVLTGSIGDVTLAIQLDDLGGSPNILYKGEAAAGTITSLAAWRMQRITIQSDGDVAIVWADGDTSFNNIWDNRAALAYS